MRILYGAHATGNGHISRACTLAKRDDIEIDYIFSGRERDKYFDMDLFGNYQTKDGISFIYHKGCKCHWKTIMALKPLTFYKDIRTIDVSRYDVVISDGEPISAWSAKLQKKPSISMSHLLSYFHDEVPKTGKGYPFIDKLITKHLAPANVQLGVFWHHFGAKNILPPFVEERPETQNNNAHECYLVYLPFENLEDIEATLKPLKGVNFLCYHPDIREEREDGHIQWHEVSRTKFKQSLQKCVGVIANGGFYLASECLQLGKKMLIKPLLGQWEQLTNAFILSQFELCHSMNTLNTEKIEEWLESPNARPIVFPHDPTPLVDWLVKGNWHDTASICETLWNEVQFPNGLQEKLTRIDAALGSHTCSARLTY